MKLNSSESLVRLHKTDIG